MSTSAGSGSKAPPETCEDRGYACCEAYDDDFCHCYGKDGEFRGPPQGTPACSGCKMPDPCGYHYDDCPLLEPGDILVSRATGEIIGEVE
ncbi:MAG: hypothetical protein Q8R28_15120 [Dehalococcoidia bacterium]|nr:hypothetical protein [Dehalococcoidia bacterium]